MSTPTSIWRRGLPREHGGQPWPQAGLVSDIHVWHSPSAAALEPKEPQGSVLDERTTTARRGLPRRAGGEAWPPADFTPALRAGSDETATDLEDPPHSYARESVSSDGQGPLVPPTVEDGRLNPVHQPEPEPKRYGPFTLRQWVGAGVLAGVALLVVVTMVVLFTRWLVSVPFMRDFLATYPGEYELPEGAPIGFPAWLNWQHFLNVFLLVLIIRSGLQVRFQKRPNAFWTPRWNKERKISLTVWFHQSIDILWLVNGVIFVFLLFVSGQWMRIVPTSWEVFPNALSAVLQYLSLDWPTENGWVNYNSIQQLTYFLVVFVASPLAAATGVRMSGIWPTNAQRLNVLYPIEWARAVHFPTMVFFVLFIVVHVTLVFATGALRNLNHMYAAQGSTDPLALAENWTGFWIFSASLLLIVAALVAARPLLLAPIARLFGSVSSR